MGTERGHIPGSRTPRSKAGTVGYRRRMEGEKEVKAEKARRIKLYAKTAQLGKPLQTSGDGTNASPVG